MGHLRGLELLSCVRRAASFPHLTLGVSAASVSRGTRSVRVLYVEGLPQGLVPEWKAPFGYTIVATWMEVYPR